MVEAHSCATFLQKHQHVMRDSCGIEPCVAVLCLQRLVQLREISGSNMEAWQRVVEAVARRTQIVSRKADKEDGV